MASLKKSIAGHSSMGEIIESYIHWLTTGTTSLFQWPKLQNKKNTYNNILILNIFISQNFHTHTHTHQKKKPDQIDQILIAKIKRKEGDGGREAYEYEEFNVLVANSLVWLVWSGVKEEVEIEENGGEGKEQWHFLV